MDYGIERKGGLSDVIVFSVSAADSFANPVGTGNVYTRPASNRLIIDLSMSLTMFL